MLLLRVWCEMVILESAVRELLSISFRVFRSGRSFLSLALTDQARPRACSKNCPAVFSKRVSSASNVRVDWTTPVAAC